MPGRSLANTIKPATDSGPWHFKPPHFGAPAPSHGLGGVLQHTALALLLNALSAGVFLLDAFATVLDMNAAAIEVVARGDALEVRGSRLRALRSSDDLRLQRIVRSAAARRALNDAEQIIAMPRRSGRQPYLVWTRSTPRRAALPEMAAARALLWVTDPERPGSVSEYVLRRIWDLTPREAQVTAAIVAGRSRDETAATLGISENAVNFHLKRVFRKTGTHRLDALVGLVLRSTAGLQI